MYHQSFLSKTVATVALAIALFLAGCDKKDEDAKVALKSIIVTPATNPVSLAKGDTYQLTAKPDPANAADVNIQWTSSAPAIATVSDAGLILAVEVGSATITASSGSIKSTPITVDVSPKALISFEVSPTRIDNLIVDDDLLLTVTKTPADAGGSFSFLSGNTNIATVSDDGLVRAVGAGSTEITVTPVGSNVAAKKVPVTVVLPALISFTVTPLNLKEFGIPAQLEIVKTPDIAGGSFTYKSNDADVVTVSETGLVTIVGKGSTTITVTSDNNVTPVQASVTVGDALVNAQRPFQGENVIIPALGERMQQLVGWTHNPSWLISYTTDNGTSMIIFSAPAWALSHADNGKVYQTVTLQSGSYTLAFVGVGSPNNNSVEAYGVVTTAETLPDLAEVTTDSRVLAYSELSAASGRHEIPFTLSGASSVTIGWVYSTFDNPDVWSNLYMDGIELTKE